ncbi:MAG: hypothetical protein BWY83_02016 [bacterium ADurb.Bin478]|nr:MAG: hypothetical protein BWY83_02016 [bacterium ADurb.Bin478]
MRIGAQHIGYAVGTIAPFSRQRQILRHILPQVVSGDALCKQGHRARRVTALSVLIAIEMDGAAVHIEKQLVLFERALDARVDVADRGRIDVLYIHKYIVMIAEKIAEISAEAAAPFVAALLGGDIDDAGHGLSVFRVKGAGNNLQLLHHIFVDIHHAGAVIDIGDRNAVDPIAHFAASAASYVQTAACIFDEPGLQFDGFGDFGDRQGLNTLGAHHRGSRCLILDHHRPLRQYGDRFTEIQHRAGEFKVQGRCQIDRDVDVFHARGGISDHLGCHDIGAGRQIENHVLAVDIRDRAHHGSLDDDIRARQSLFAGGIHNLPGNFSGGSSRQGERVQGAKEEHQRNPVQQASHRESPQFRNDANIEGYARAQS